MDAALWSRMLTRPAFMRMRNLLDPSPILCFQQANHHQQEKRFSEFHFTTSHILKTYEENNLEPIVVTSFDPNQNTTQEFGLHSFHDQASEMLRAFSDTFPKDHSEDIVSDGAVISEQK